MPSHPSTDAAPTAKQLVFLFMAATVVAVVVFLCGVLVGRGVPAAEGSAGPTVGPSGEVAFDDDQLRRPILDSVSRESSAAASSGDDLTYYRRLGSQEPVTETIGEAPATEPTPAAPAPTPTPREPERPMANAAEGAAAAPVSKNRSSDLPANAMVSAEGYTVQVTALRRPDAARQVAVRLLARGFPAYVVQPASDAPVAVYRVRVGRYADRGEAERVLQRLEREEQFKPWITR